MVTETRERTKSQFPRGISDISVRFEKTNTGKYKVELELTEEEADCLLNCFSSIEETLGINFQQDQLSVIAMIYRSLADIFPELIANERVKSFWESHKRANKNEGYSKTSSNNDSTITYSKQDLKTMREDILAELQKLNKREEFIRTRCIREVLFENERYPVERHCPVEITKRLNLNTEYCFIAERKQRLRSELAKTFESD